MAEELAPDEIVRFLATNLNEEKAYGGAASGRQREGFDRGLIQIVRSALAAS
jgi:hypothetical protein